MNKKERDFMFDLAELMAKYGVSLEATTINDSVYETPSIRIETVQIQDIEQGIDIDLYGCLYPADIMNLAKLD